MGKIGLIPFFDTGSTDKMPLIPTFFFVFFRSLNVILFDRFSFPLTTIEYYLTNGPIYFSLSTQFIRYVGGNQ